MAAWVFNIPIILSFLPNYITIKFTTSLSFILSSFILYFSFRSVQGKFSNLGLIVVSFSILTIWLIMVTILTSIIFGFNSGIENLFITDTTMAAVAYVPGQPSLGTIIAFLLVTILGLNIFYEGRLKAKLFLLLGSLVFLIGLVAVIGLIFSIPIMYYYIPSVSNPISIPASLLFILLGLSFTLLFDLIRKNQA